MSLSPTLAPNYGKARRLHVLFRHRCLRASGQWKHNASTKHYLQLVELNNTPLEEPSETQHQMYLVSNLGLYWTSFHASTLLLLLETLELRVR